jgi:N-acetylglucosaminyl-diphospho-decaprenol L-rhamnosyltransferase
MKLAIIIVNWNVRELLLACLDSIAREVADSELEAEIWVVDNASEDGSAAAVRERFPNVRLLASKKNLGFAGGNNAALKELGFPGGSDLPEAVLLLNPDTVVKPGAFRALLAILADQPRAGIVGPQLQNSDGSFQHGAFAFPGLWQLAIELLPSCFRFNETRWNGRYPREWYRTDKPFAIGHPLGAAFLIRGETIKEIGLMDESYELYCEEVDWALRAKRAGWQAYCAPAAKIVHFAGQSTAQIRHEAAIRLWRSRYRFYHQHYSPLKVWLAGRVIDSGMNLQARQLRRQIAEGAVDKLEGAARLDTLEQIRRIWQKG